MVDTGLIRDDPKQLSRLTSWSSEGGARDLARKRDDDMQSVMKEESRRGPKEEVTKLDTSDVRPIEEHPKTGSSTGQYEDQFKARLPHSRDGKPWIPEGSVHQRELFSFPGRHAA